MDRLTIQVADPLMTALAGLLMRRSDQGASPLDRRLEPNGTTRSSNRPQARTVATHEAVASGMLGLPAVVFEGETSYK